MRNSATRSLLSRRDVVIVASVSCIYGLGSPDAYEHMSVQLSRGGRYERDDLLRRLTSIQYQRNNIEFRRGTFRVRGDVVEVFPAYEQDLIIRLEFFDDELESITEVDSLRGEITAELEQTTIFPASHYITPEVRMKKAIELIEKELSDRLLELRSRNKLLEAQRLEQRTRFDLEILRETGFCPGIENYSRHLDGRAAGEPPATLLNYFPEDFLLVIDESHQTVPQIGGMYRGDRARKETLVEFGFRLPSALDNRPLKFEEWEKLARQVIFVSATPATYEIERSAERVVEQVIRPTGLLDPLLDVRRVEGQVDDLLSEINARAKRNERVLVTTLTKRMAEELSDYYRGLGVRVRYMHSDIDTIERAEIIRDLRAGKFDVLVGINLLREGLDLPEVSLVAILDADKEGFLRSTTSLIQTFGRAARNVEGRVVMYAEKTTEAMERAIAETRRRRALQEEYNRTHGITPSTIKKAIRDILESVYESDYVEVGEAETKATEEIDPKLVRRELDRVRREMRAAAEKLEFERAAELRDRLRDLERLELRYL
jgi:excinuclease ABC subunit B